ncbi:MAG: gfo/Idh/MocA family oxidoreductase [Candidatus Omnitrophota bacterium]|jgi:predicted dehydrogenase|nr:MAG: gfo/Idh/MocA family oxidoreductase [Candidatus Omnitrophota bacterium]
MHEHLPDRRAFLKKIISGTAGILAVSKSFSPSRIWGANDRIHVAVIGCGGRGNYLNDTIHRLGETCNVEVTAICDVSKTQLQRTAASIRRQSAKEPIMHQRYREILAWKDVDAVMIAAPDFAHARILTEAALAGKHAYCEKPMASNMADANAAVDAVEAKKVICQIGTQRRSHVPHQKAVELVRSGILGLITEVDAQYNRCTASWLRDFSDVRKEDIDWEQFLMFLPMREFDPCRYRCWHLYRDYTIGLAGLLGTHVIDVGPWFLDDPLPESASGTGGVLVWKEKREHYDTMESTFLFPKGFMLQFTSRLGNSAGGTEVQIRGTKGTFDTATLTASGAGGGNGAIREPITIENQNKYPDWSDAMPHIENWLTCIRSGEKPNADVHVGYAQSAASIMAHRACDEGRRVRFDPIRREIV